MNKIIPTVFAHNAKEFKQRYLKLLKLKTDLQIDFMDGKLVPAKSMSLNSVPNVGRHHQQFEAHLMVADPINWIDRIKAKGFNKIIFHREALKTEKEALTIIDEIWENDMEAWVAINPQTPLSEVASLLPVLDGILFMGVTPGAEGQLLDHHIIETIRNLRITNIRIPIQVDGGINAETAPLLIQAGANILNTGSYVTESKNPKEALKYLEDIVNTHHTKMDFDKNPTIVE